MRNSPKQFAGYLARKKATTTMAERVEAHIAAITSPPWRDTMKTEPPPSRERERHAYRVHLFSLKCQAKQLIRSINGFEELLQEAERNDR